ncbi:VCBS repeat-containing protein [Candidatus Uhrbacteria bacterium]|nr:VCBS repeat-containing protein [Candidatus Uhrbacteria bacterium]
MRKLLCGLLSITVILTGSAQTKAFTDDHEFVRTANYFLMSGSTLDDAIDTLATFDLIVIPVEAQVYNKTFFAKIRDINSDIVILPYIATVSWNDLYWNDSLHQSLYRQIEDDWWLTDGNGKQVSVWTGTRALNLNSGWSEYLPEFVKTKVLSTGYWDGVFYDEVQDSISWVGNVDVNKDGKNDSATTANSLWASRYQDLFKTTRQQIGKKYIMITNGSSNPDFAPYVNGRMFETFPSSDDTLTEWKNMTHEYLHLENDVGYDSVQVLNVNSENTGENNDYRKIRFGITTTLLGNGYFAFDYGTENHSQLWTYDEYGAYLGAPKGDLQNTLNPQDTEINTGVWMRDFEQGAVIVNATVSTQTVKLDGDYEKLHGTQDTSVNNGSIVSQITLASKDGIVLLRPIETIVDAVYENGAFARVYNLDGETTRTGFFAYDSTKRGGTQIISFDTDNDGERETVVANDTYVYIYESDGSLYKKFAPYTETYTRGINIAVGDIENDGTVEIVTGTENGGGPHVRVFNGDGVLINPGFFAYADSFRGGVNVAIGDLNGDGIKEIICGAGYNGGPHVRVFAKNGKLLNPGFFAYDKSFRGGVNVSVGDVDGDGIDDIVTGPGLGGSPLARVYDRDGNLKSEFYVFDHTDRDGLEVVAADIDDDGIDEILGLTSDVFTLSAF